MRPWTPIAEPFADAALVEGIVPLVPGLTDRLRTGIDVADVGCGSGHAINVLAQAFPNRRLVGYTFSEEAIDQAQAEAAELGLTNARFEVRDVAELNETEGLRPGDGIRREPRPGPPRTSGRGCSCPTSRRDLPHGRHQGREQRR